MTIHFGRPLLANLVEDCGAEVIVQAKQMLSQVY
jgi:hypothetical protein